MGKLFWVLLFVVCLVAVQGKKKTAKNSNPKPDDAEGDFNVKSMDTTQEEEDEKSEDVKEAEQPEKLDDEEGSTLPDDDEEDAQKFSCNLKFKRVGCYADKSKSNKPLKSFIMSDSDMGSVTKKGKLPNGETFNTELPKFACKCANEAINSGNAIFGIQNIAECWSGPDNSKYDKDGPAGDCVTFDYQPCDDASEVCAGKKHSNFVYYVDTPEHTKSKDQVQQELAAEAAAKKKKAATKKKADAKKKAKKSNKKRGKKSKKE